MQTSDPSLTFECRSCGTEITWGAGEKRCADCGAWPTVSFGQQHRHSDPDTRSPRGSMWDFDSLLPYDSEDGISLGEGATPLIESPEIARSTDIDRLWIKDEGQNPTGSIRDRELSLAATDAVARDAERGSLVAPGAAVQSFGAYAARANLAATAGLPARAPFQRKAMTNVHGVDLTVVRGRLQETRKEFQTNGPNQNLGLSFDAFRNPFRHTGVRTVAAEIVSFFTGSVPDAIVVPTGSGTVLVGLYEGFHSLDKRGDLDTIPQLYAVQPTGCAPIVEAARTGNRIESVHNPDTVCGELEVPAPRGGQWVRDVLVASDGGGVAVSDDDILEAGINVASKTGLELGPDAAAGLAGIKKLRENGDLGSTSTVVAIGTGTGGADLLRSRLETP